MQIDFYMGVKRFDEPKWTVTETGVAGPFWRREKVYSATNGIVEITGMSTAMVAQLPLSARP